MTLWDSVFVLSPGDFHFKFAHFARQMMGGCFCPTSSLKNSTCHVKIKLCLVSIPPLAE